MCLLCGDVVAADKIGPHKSLHPREQHYGIMWPVCGRNGYSRAPGNKIPIYESPSIAEIIGVERVYIRDEGQNRTGSMKDYIVERALEIGLHEGSNIFTVISSGNHAVSLATLANLCNAYAVVFTPASSSKIALLSTLPKTLVVGIKDAIFEDVYELANNLDLPYLFNANVSNEELFVGFGKIAEAARRLDPMPTHILAGVGNGSYLAGITWGFSYLQCPNPPAIVPVGMKGAFPLEKAFAEKKSIHEYAKFHVPEELIDAAEGSIAIASYSMPQLIQALKVSHGFTLGDLTNEDLKEAYQVLACDPYLINVKTIPEPTGIMGLAAAIKHRGVFSKKDRLLIPFTGNGSRDASEVAKLAPELAEWLPIQVSSSTEKSVRNIILVEKEIPRTDLARMVSERVSKEVNVK